MKLLSVKEVGEMLGLGQSTITRLIKEGSLSAICVRAGRRKKFWRVRREELERWVAQKEQQSAVKKKAVNKILSIVEPDNAKGEV